MMPKGDTFPELTSRLADWPKALEAIDALGYADHVLFRNNDEEALKKGFAQLARVGLPIAMEVGAVKEWGPSGKATFDAQKPMWDKFISLGANIKGIVMDEPLVAVLSNPHFDYLGGKEEKFEYAVTETADFIRRVREAYPDWVIADIEVYPFFDADFVIKWIDALEAKLKSIGVQGQDFFRMDVDWVAFKCEPSGWEQVKRIEDHCKKIGLRFSQIYWASDVPGSQEKQADPTSWYTGIMRMGEAYEAVGGNPDQYVVQTWIGLPHVTLPESEDYSFTRSVVDFNKRFVK